MDAAKYRIEQFGDVDAGDCRALIEYLDAVALVSADDKPKTFAAQNLGIGMHVLDIGCGTGDDVRAIAELVGPSGRAVGVDSSRAMIDEARSRGGPPNVAFALGPAESLPFESQTFDAVRAERVFQHLAQPEPAARELHRVLRPSGSALLLDQDWESLILAGAERAQTRRIVRALVDALADGWAAREARGRLRRAGFRSVEIAPLVATPTLPIAFDFFLQSAMQAALRTGSIDAEAAHAWLQALLQADRRGEFFCAITVIVAVGHA